MKKLLILCVLVMAMTGARAEDGLFPFVLPWDDASQGITNVSDWLEKTAGKSGFVHSQNGHLYAGDKRIRFLGVNTVFDGNFPTHEEAEKIAARMARFGINCVRFHHMDSYATPRGIWQPGLKLIDPGQMDKLDYFIAQLKEHGIYSDLNLHVSLTYPDMPEWKDAPKYSKGLDLFYPPMLERQRDYARQLLTHVNPYTKSSYVDEPAVAFIEINNENGLIDEWWKGSLDRMPEVYQVELAKLWTSWLTKKYTSREVLKSAWSKGEQPVGTEMLKNGNFAGDDSSWVLEQHGGAKSLTEKIPEGLKIKVQEAGTETWHTQLEQPGISFEAGKSYTLAFRAKSEPPRKIKATAAEIKSPWKVIWSTDFDLTPEWQDFRVVFNGDTQPDGRLIFGGMGLLAGEVFLADVSLKPGGVQGLQEGESAASMPIFPKKDYAARSETAQMDWMDFLWDVEEKYWTGMSDFIKKDLKAKSLVLGTAADFSPSPIQAKLDVVDAHAYWQHPRFPGKPWDSENWIVNNLPMAGVQGGGIIPKLALRRVEGKPFICTEFNAAAPNSYAGETFLLLSAYASLQDWDGIFIFAWSHRAVPDVQKIPSFFDVDQHPVKMATLPAAAALFLRGDVAPAKDIIRIPVSREEGIGKSTKSGARWDLEAFGMDKTAPLLSRTQMQLVEKHASAETAKIPEEKKSLIVSDTAELTWNTADQRVLINTMRSKALIGKSEAGPVSLGDVSIEILSTLQKWGSVSVTAMDGKDFKSPGKILITATGVAENTGMVWKTPEKNSVGKNWGKAPSLVEGIGVKIVLPVSPSKVQAWALDEKGQRGKPVSLQASGEGTLLQIGVEYQTLWYELEIK